MKKVLSYSIKGLLFMAITLSLSAFCGADTFTDIVTAGGAVTALMPILAMRDPNPTWGGGSKENPFKKLSAEEVSKLDDGDVVVYSKALNKHNEEREAEITESLKKLGDENEANKEELDTLKEEMKGIDLATMKTALKAIELQGVELNKMKESGAISKETFEGKLKSMFDDNVDAIIKADKTQTTHSMTVDKATQTYGDITSGDDFAQMRAGVIDKPVRAPRIRSLFSTIPLSTEFYKYTQQTTVVRDAQNVAKCTAVVSTTKETLTVSSIETKVVQDEIEFCRMFIADYPFMASRINKLINQSIALRVDEQLLLGTGLLEETFSIASTSSEFSAANPACVLSLAVQEATMVDLILGMQTQIIELGQQNAFDPNVVLVNKCDWFKEVESRKDLNNNYLDGRVTMVNGVPFIGGMMVMWTPIVAQNTLYVFDSTQGEVVDRQQLVLETAFENKDNFSKHIATLLGYERLNFLVPSELSNAFMKSTNVALAITAITKL